MNGISDIILIMGQSKSIIKLFDEEASRKLFKMGLLRRMEGIFVWEVRKDVIGSLGLNTATYNSNLIVDVNPVVGINHLRIEKLIAELRQRKFHTYTPVTYAVPLGYLTPENTYKKWSFWANADWEEPFHDMLDAFVKYGIPFVEKNSSLQVLCQEMATGKYGHFLVPTHELPVAYFLLGNYAAAKDQVEKQLEEQKDRTDETAVEYRKFVERFLERIKEAQAKR